MAGVPSADVEVEAILGLGSRYSYLAFTQLEGIEARTGCRFRLVPVDSAELMHFAGPTPFTGPPPSTQYDWDYRRRDAEDWAAYYGVRYVEPTAMPVDTQLLARACHAAGEDCRSCMAALYARIFGGQAAANAQACIDVAVDVGLDQAAFSPALSDPATAAAATGAARDAAARGAFGVPTFFVGGRLFWGNDRLVLLEDALKRKGPG